MSVSIREGRVEDAAALAALLAELGYPAGADQVAQRVRALTEQDSGRLLVAEEGGQVTGLLHLAIIPMVHEPAGWGRVAALVVRGDRRRAGVGRALLVEAERVARADGCGIVEITTSPSRRDAHGFYRAVGYEEASRRFLKRLR